MSAERPSPARQQVYTDLVAGLLDAHDDPAGARFDEELDRALAQGTVTAETARRLRFWQRASVRALADHARTVVPTALGALDASRRETSAVVEQLADTLGADEQVQDDASLPEPPVAADTPGPASSTPAAVTSTLGPRAHRLIVADLVTATPDLRIEHR